MNPRDSAADDVTAPLLAIDGAAPTLLPGESLPHPGAVAASDWQPVSQTAILRPNRHAISDPPDQEDPDAAPTRVGTTLTGKYRIERLLGQGGCGRVYLATHLHLRTQVAIKFLLAHWASRSVFRERFRREARVLAILSHPGIVGVHDFGDDAGDMYLVMEYVRGQPLSQLILTDGQPMPPERAADFIAQILDVLIVAHERGIVHREVLKIDSDCPRFSGI